MPRPAITGSSTQLVGDYGIYAVFLLMLIDAVFPAASEVVMVYGGAIASGAIAGDVGDARSATRSPPGCPPTSRSSLAGTIGYLIGSIDRLGDRPTRGPAVPRAARALAPPRPGEARSRREAWFERWEDWAVLLGRLTPGRPVVRLDPRRRLRGAAPPLHGADADRLRDLVLRRSRAIGWAAGASWEGFHHAFRYADYRRRGRDRRRCRLARLAIRAQAASAPIRLT